MPVCEEHPDPHATLHPSDEAVAWEESPALDAGELEIVPFLADVHPLPSAIHKGDRRGVLPAFFLSVTCHVLIAGVFVAWLSKHFTAPAFQFQKNAGQASGDSLQASNDVAPRGAARPELSIPAPDMARLASDSPPANDSAEADPTSFVPPPYEIQDQDSAPAFFGVNIASTLRQTPIFRRHGPKAQAVSEPGKSTGIAGGPVGDHHVWTGVQPAGTGGSGGHGSASDGLDNRGLPMPDYPVESRRRGEHGLVNLQVLVRADGSVGAVTIIADSGFPRLAEAAVQAIRRGHFLPATCDGRPMPATVIVPYLFVLHS